MVFLAIFNGINDDTAALWRRRITSLRYAFQPIVNIHSGVVFGYEALLRGYGEAGFSSIAELFDEAWRDKVLYSLDLALREIAIRDFAALPGCRQMKLFYNLDNRILEMPDYLPNNTAAVLKRYGLDESNLIFEISEQHEFSCYHDTQQLLDQYQEQNYRIAIDDFGSGYAGMTLLYHSEPDVIKIDRFFITGIHRDKKKRFFVASIVQMARLMGIHVVAEGIEEEAEFYTCREIGCDSVQGYLVERPKEDHALLLRLYERIPLLVEGQNRADDREISLLKRHMRPIKACFIDSSAQDILKWFRDNQADSIYPVVNRFNEPQGLLRERDLKKYVYSPYGISILQHQAADKGIAALVSRVPVVDVATPIDSILDYYSMDDAVEEILITENGAYAGVLDSRAFLNLISQRKISMAREQNPLTKLPGNWEINRYISRKNRKGEQGFYCVYFDFDDFKPFNDNYGFRQGDRVIQLFADLLREYSRVSREFIGHIGGDDFFMGFSGGPERRDEIRSEVGRLQMRFRQDAVAFYGKADRETGGLTAYGRDGRRRTFPLITVSAAILYIAGRGGRVDLDTIPEHIAGLKKSAKESVDQIAFAELDKLNGSIAD